MRWFCIAICAFVISVSVGVRSAFAYPPDDLTPYEQSEKNIRTTLKYVWPALRAEHKIGRIYYEGVCPSEMDNFVGFPHVVVQPQVGGANSGTVRRILQKDKRVLVSSDDGAGIIRIRIGDISEDILRIRISSIRMSPIGQYNSDAVIGALEFSPEVQSAMRRYGLHVPLTLSNTLVVQPATGLPHIPEIIADMTLDQALDLVAKQFGGIVLYGICTQSRSLDIRFIGGVNFDESWLDQ